MAFDRRFIESRINESARGITSLLACTAEIESIAVRIRQCLTSNRVLLTCGNGGSAAEALHLAEECIGKYRRVRRPFAAVCLNADPTALTCIANDFGYDHVFERQAEALVNPGDVLVGFSTSGNSRNVLLALKKARERGGTAIALLGKTGGECKHAADIALVVGHDDTAIIQQAHEVITHLILESLEATDG